MIELGEATGRLEEVLNSLSKYYEREAEIRNGIQKSITYPLIMTVMMIAVILVLIAKVLPVFSQIYAELGSDLTGFARMLMHISNLINRYMIVFVIAFVILFVIGLMLYQTDLGRVLFQDNCSQPFCQLHVSGTCQRSGYRPGVGISRSTGKQSTYANAHPDL